MFQKNVIYPIYAECQIQETETVTEKVNCSIYCDNKHKEVRRIILAETL